MKISIQLSEVDLNALEEIKEKLGADISSSKDGSATVTLDIDGLNLEVALDQL